MNVSEEFTDLFNQIGLNVTIRKGHTFLYEITRPTNDYHFDIDLAKLSAEASLEYHHFKNVLAYGVRIYAKKERLPQRLMSYKSFGTGSKTQLKNLRLTKDGFSCWNQPFNESIRQHVLDAYLSY